MKRSETRVLDQKFMMKVPGVQKQSIRLLKYLLYFVIIFITIFIIIVIC